MLVSMVMCTWYGEHVFAASILKWTHPENIISRRHLDVRYSNLRRDMTPWQIKIRGEEVIPRSRLTRNLLFPTYKRGPQCKHLCVRANICRKQSQHPCEQQAAAVWGFRLSRMLPVRPVLPTLPILFIKVMSSQTNWEYFLVHFHVLFRRHFLPLSDQPKLDIPRVAMWLSRSQWPTRIYADHYASSITVSYQLHRLNLIPTVFSTVIVIPE